MTLASRSDCAPDISPIIWLYRKKSTPERVDFFIPLPALKLPDFH
ncbi:hypothetical protein ATN83_4242 [Raoultella ornithinolytica]|nr:hypothetical protein ATN83_4242 [Raoultella ornithinolytica]KDV94995.1 hypothetical protein AB00_0575 [Raoultella ornithinolytica 2-156-04_S1_C1]KDX15832.1 hypothetical protein AB28_0582 [Raoultella ornithinolytica 2-156-04_S1_C2]